MPTVWATAPDVQVDIDEIIPIKSEHEKEIGIDNLITLYSKCHIARHFLLSKEGLDSDFLYMKYNKISPKET